jgi:EAL domain-containing protein (putative c-di-GMP-specific phosphodiesterase class I)
VQFGRDEFVNDLAELVTRTGINPHHLKLELTESAVVKNIDELVDKMHAIRALGVTLAMDDFGTGQSSLTNLRRLPVQQLKIDQSFVRHLPHNASDLAIVRTIIAMSGTLGLEVVAEGVESQAQYQALAENGCLAYQGLFFGAPMPLDAFQALTMSGTHLPVPINASVPQN